MMDYAWTFMGLPYRWGGDDPINGYDCSGLVIEIFQSVGLLAHTYDNTAQGLYSDLSPTSEKLATPAAGALAFFGSSRITHVGLCIDEKLMIEAGGGNSTTVSSEAAARQNAFVRIRPVSFRKDLKAILLHKSLIK